MTNRKITPRRIALLALVVIAGAALAWIRSSASASEVADGTITAIDLATRRASIEIIIPATGATRELSGTIPGSCRIEIDGRPATLADARVGDRVEVRARIQRSARGPDGKRQTRFTAEDVRVTRARPAGS